MRINVVCRKNRLFLDRNNFIAFTANKMTDYLDICNNQEISKPGLKKINHKRSLTTELVIKVPDHCNLQCIYCSSDSNTNETKQEFNLDKLYTAIDYVIKNVMLNKIVYKKENSKPANIIITGGGEPALYWDIVQGIVEYVNTKYKNNRDLVTLKILTNGQMSEKKMDWLIENYDGIYVSTDGNSVQDIQRPRFDKKSSQMFIDQILKKLNNSNKSFGVKMTVTSLGVNQLIVDVTDILEKYPKIEFVQVEPFVSVGRAKKNKITTVKARQFVKAYDFLAKQYPHKILNFYDFYNQNNSNCSSLNGIGICLTYDGTLSACNLVSRDDALWDDLVVGKITAEKVHISKDKVDLKIDDKCHKCFAYNFCYGGCPFKMSRNKKGQIVDRIGRENCKLTKAIVKSIIKRKLTSSNKEFALDSGRKIKYTRLDQ